MNHKQQKAWLSGVRVAFIWIVAVTIFFPIFWMVLTSLKTETDAIAIPPSFFFSPTLENYLVVQDRSDYLKYAMNSVVISVLSTVTGILLAIPAAWSMAFFPSKRTRSTLLWMLSTKMMPAVGVLVPIYLIFKNVGLLDTRTGLIIVFTLSNLPILIWMLYTYFKELPREILEAARMDGANTFEEMLYILMPVSVSGIASTMLFSMILAWNESFWSINLSASQAGTLSMFITSYTSPEGLFWAKLSAASTMAVAPIVVLGWLGQRQLVRGMTFGAVK